MDLRRMRQDGFVVYFEADGEDAAQRQETAFVRQMRAGRRSAQALLGLLPGFPQDRVHAEAQAPARHLGGDVVGRVELDAKFVRANFEGTKPRDR